MELYQLPYSHHCAKVRIVLLEKGLEHRLPPFPGGSVRSPEFAGLNPLGKVPFLVDGDVRLGESEVIVEYLEERYPMPAMLPADPASRARSRWLSRLHDLYFGKELSTLFVGLSSGGREDPAMGGELEELERLTDLWERSVDPRPYFFGKDFGLSDAAFSLSFEYLQQLSTAYGRPVDPRRIPRLLAWWDAVSTRPSVSTVLAECRVALAEG